MFRQQKSFRSRSPFDQRRNRAKRDLRERGNRSKRQSRSKSLSHSRSRSYSRSRSRSRSFSGTRSRSRSFSGSRSRSRSFSGSHSEGEFIDEEELIVPDLPIHTVKNKIIELVEKNQIMVITGDTGSGKSTQLAQFLIGAGYKSIAVTQPRRVGAISVARRVAEEMKVRLGEEVGYTVRFDDLSSRRTKIKFLTDGCLLRECLVHKNLDPYSIVILDEAHERSLHTDILFGLVRDIAKRRSDIKIIITSATLDKQKFSEYYGNCPTYHIPGRCFPVEILHSETSTRFHVQATIDTILKIHQNEPPNGHILAFLTGQEEIETAYKKLGKRVDQLIDDGIDMPDIVILRAYGALPAQEQHKIFRPVPENCRKVVISTNICETSLTVDGIAYVVDPGLVKQRNFNPQTGIDSLMVVPISQVSAKQRAGRAGRTREGICYRLYTEKRYTNDFLKETVPEIQRTSLSNTVLMLKTLGINDPLSFDFMDNPSKTALIDALKNLFYLDAININGEITPTGKRMAQFPLEPSLSKVLMLSMKYGCLQEMLTIASMLSSEGIWLKHGAKENQQESSQQQQVFWSKYGDHITLLFLYDSWKRSGCNQNWTQKFYVQQRSLLRAKHIRQQLEGIVKQTKHGQRIREDKNPILQCRRVIAECFFPHAAQYTRIDTGPQRTKQKMSVPYRPYQTPKEGLKFLYMHPTSSLQSITPQWIVYNEIVYTSKPFMQHICHIEYDWIKDLLPKLREADTQRLTGRDASSLRDNIDTEMNNSGSESEEKTSSKSSKSSNAKRKKHDPYARNTTQSAKQSARERFLERKRQKLEAKRKKNKKKKNVME